MKKPFCHEFSLRDVPFQRQKYIDVIYKNKVIKGQRLDLLVFGEIVVEIKSVRKLEDIFMAQTLSYLKSTKLKRATCIVD